MFRRTWTCGSLLIVAGVIALPDQSLANDQDLHRAVGEIAAAHKNGNPAQAVKLATALAKEVGDFSDLMQVLKKSGDDGYSIAAIGDVSLAMPKGGAKNQKAWGGFAKDLRKTGLALAQAKGHYNRRRPPPTSRLFATIATASSRIEATMIRNIVKDLFES